MGRGANPKRREILHRQALKHLYRTLIANASAIPFPLEMNSPLIPVSCSSVLEILIGNIASGKSSWTEPRASEGWVTVNNDSLARSMHGGNYDWERQIPGLKTSLGILIVETAGAQGRSVVIDNTNRTSSGRLPFVAAARRAGMKVRAILFPRSSPETHARRRFEADARGMPHDYWLEVARLVDQEWAPPGDDEVDDLVCLPENWRETVLAEQSRGGPVDLDRLFRGDGYPEVGLTRKIEVDSPV